jgi:hypothetical protein
MECRGISFNEKLIKVGGFMDDFYCTAQRMWNDANILKNNTNSFFNTCYLSGYIVECYGKILITASAVGNPRSYNHNIEDINNVIQTNILLNTSYSKYCLDLKTMCNTIYEGQHKWNPIKRYEDDPNLWNSKNVAESFVVEAKHVIDVIDNMKLDGVI